VVSRQWSAAQALLPVRRQTQPRVAVLKEGPGLTWQRFADTEQGQKQLLLLAQLAETFGCRPSEAVSCQSSVVSLQFDLACFAALCNWRDQGREQEEGTRNIYW
jgi:hypothetical protein